MHIAHAVLRNTLVGLIALLGAAGTQAQAPAANAEDAMWSGEPIRIGYRQDAFPFSFVTGRDTPTGYMVELCQAIVQKLRDPRGKAPAVRFMTIPTDKVESDMRDGFVDLLCSATTDT
ncbi:MAG: transporter substrate-binding domain-containing protein, partial [Pseudazoarcus pumilus]|nr:transporter substrate-binding domain-containing protein [Pseudazoarcus pumilus]